MRLQRRKIWRLVFLTVIVAVSAVAVAYAQRFGRFAPRGLPVATIDSFDGGFQYCRAVFRGIQGGIGGGWTTDYPDADRNLSIRLSELTKTPVSMDAQKEPKHLIVQLTSPELFHCPVIFMYEVGNLFFDETEAEALRTYLVKGGFLWVDDFWGSEAWDQWVEQIHRAVPGRPIFDIPPEHPIRHMMFPIDEVEQVTNIQNWMRTRSTSERGADSPHADFRGIADDRGRLMVVMTHNTDFGDSWERESENRQFFETFSPKGYAMGVNVLLYALTH